MAQAVAADALHECLGSGEADESRGLRSWMNKRVKHGNCEVQCEAHVPLGAIKAAQSLRGRVAFIYERKQSQGNRKTRRFTREGTV